MINRTDRKTQGRRSISPRNDIRNYKMVIFTVSGSLRSESSNTKILETIKSVAPSGTEIILYHALGELPHFNPDMDKEGAPQIVQELRGMINRSDALIISTPEYAHGIPGSLKNMLDWLVSTNVINEKPVSLIMASASEANYARESLMEVLRTMNAKVLPDLIFNMPGSQTKIDEPSTWQELKVFIENLTLHTRKKS